MTQDKIKDRIRKLLALARDKGASSGEAETALAKARQMMLEHGIAEEATVEEQLKIIEGQTFDMEKKWKRILAMAVSNLMGVKHLMQLDRGIAWFVGRDDLVDAAEQTYKYVCDEVEAKYQLALKELGKHGTLTKEIRHELRKTFKEAAAVAVARKVNAILEAQRGPSNERALVVINQAASDAQAFIDEQIKPKQARALRPVRSGLGTGAGRAAGDAIKLQDNMK